MLSVIVGTGAAVCTPHATTIAFPAVEDTHPCPDPTLRELVPLEPLNLELICTRAKLPVCVEFTVNSMPLLAIPPAVVTTTLPVVAPVGTTAVMLVSLQGPTVVAVTPLNFTVPVPCDSPKPDPAITTDVPITPLLGVSPVMLGVGTTVKLMPLLAPPAVVTIMFPVVAPAGTTAVMLVSLHGPTVVAVTPLNFTVLVPCVVPKPDPAITTEEPIVPLLGVRLVMPGAGTTVKLMPLLAMPLAAVTTTFPVVAPTGTTAVMLVSLHGPTVVAVTPLKVTVLLPCVAPKLVPEIAIDVPTGPTDGDKLFTPGVTRKFVVLLLMPFTVTVTPEFPAGNPLGILRAMLGSDDLFTLLNVLRPDLVIDHASFEQMSEPNPYINDAVQHCRKARSDWQREARACLDKVTQTEWGRLFLREAPTFQETYDRLLDDQLGDSDRIRITRVIEELYTFSPFINRTRRRDIGEFTTRKPETITIDFTSDQKRLHDGLLDVIARILIRCHGQQNVKFMMTTIRRQAASCLYGLAPLLSDILSGKLDRLELMEVSDSDQEIESAFTEQVRADVEALLEQVRNLDPKDPKIEAFVRVLIDKNKRPNNKALVFSTFRHTLAYLDAHARGTGLRVGLIHGDIPDGDRASLRSRFALPKEDAEAIDVLLSSEVGCEGLDFQFCDLIINYDLPKHADETVRMHTVTAPEYQAITGLAPPPHRSSSEVFMGRRLP
jgi:hypothetical protein